jgi:hypothetical protein
MGMASRTAVRVALVASSLAALLGTCGTAGAVTVGELAPMPSSTCDGGIDAITPDAGPGNSYAVPSSGGVGSWVLTSWSTNASSEAGQSMALKIFRKAAGPATYMAVSHEARHDLSPGLNTFGASLQVSSGDLLGLHFEATTAGGACGFSAPGMSASLIGDLADGASADFNPVSDPFRVNLAAELTPTSAFSIGKVKTKPNGTAVLTLSLPNPGDLTVSGKGVKGAASAVSAKQVNAGTVKLVIRAKGKSKRKLVENGKVSVKPTISFTPTGGTATTLKKKVKLRRK